MLNLIPLQGPPSVIHNDPAPCFQCLASDEFLATHYITIEIGDHKNLNKNLVAKCALQQPIQELEGDLEFIASGGTLITATQ